jgi:omega-amidase
MNDLRITLIQSPLTWEDSKANLSHFGSVIRAVTEVTDLILLPEMFSTGFTMNAAAQAEDLHGPAVSWMRDTAAAAGATLCGSLILREEGKYFNRLVWMRPDGTFLAYDKRHLFRLAGEEKTYTGGTEKIFPELNGWRILPLICYDLRFPVWSRRTEKENYDLLLYVANWPDRRIRAWNTLLPARAVENQCYVAGLNRVGDDGNGIGHSGYSAVYDPAGEPLWQAEAGTACTQTVTLSHEALVKHRRIFAFDKDADRFTINL